MKYVRCKKIDLKTVAGTFLLIPLHAPDQALYTLNETGRLCWEAISEPQTEYQIVATLAEQYDDVSRETLQQDVREFLQEMLEMNLIEKFC